MNQDNNSNNRSGNGIPDIFNMPLGGNNDNTKSSGGTHPQMNSGMMNQPSGQSSPVPPVRPVAPQTAENPGMMGQPSGQSSSVPPVRPVAPQTAENPGMMNQPSGQSSPVPPVRPVAPQTAENPGMMGQPSGQSSPVPPVRPVAPQPAGNPGMMNQPSGQPNPVPPVRPVAPQTAGNPGMMGQPSGQSSPQSAIAESGVANEWVAAVEAQKEPTVMEPTVQAPPSVPKTVAPQTVEDLITPSMPTEPINNKKDRKTGNKKILLMIAAIVVGVLILFGAAYVWLNGRNKTLTCTLKDTDNGITYTTIGEFKFKGKKVTSVMAGLEYVVVDDTDHSSELQVVGAAFQFLDENIKKRSGTTTKLDTNDRQAKYYITIDLDKMKDSDWNNDTDSMMNVDALKEKEKDYKTIKEELTDQGYTCK